MGINTIIIILLTVCGVTELSYAQATNGTTYDIDSSVNIEGVGDDINLLGQVSVTSLGNCEYRLQVLHLVMTGSDGQNISIDPSGLYQPINFTIIEGNGALEVRASSNDVTLSLRIKRIIIDVLETYKKFSLINNTQIYSTQCLLKRGEQYILLSEEYKNVVLVVGNTGSGKTTFTQWIAGNDNNLIAEEETPGLDQYIIVDGDKKIGDNLVSKTIYPELVVNSKTKTAFYDLPGFSDTRSTSNDIATSYFIKKILDHAEKIKLIFLVNHLSVSRGGDRNDFRDLVKSANNIFKHNLDSFDNSIAIVATKVDNRSAKDNVIINSIADFLKSIKKKYERDIKLSSTSNENKVLYKDVITFINILLVKEDEQYSKIGIFRRPDKAGPLSTIPAMQEAKGHIETIIRKLKYTDISKFTFGYTISDSSKNYINDLVENIKDNIVVSVSELATELKIYYWDLLKLTKNEIDLIVFNNWAESDLTVVHSFLNKLRTGNVVITNMNEIITNMTTPESLSNLIINNVTSLNITVSKSITANILNQVRYLQFLKDVSDKDFNTKTNAFATVSSFRQLLNDFSNINENFRDYMKIKINQIEVNVTNTIGKSGKDIVEFYVKKEKSGQSINALYQDFEYGYENILRIQKLANSFDIHKCLQFLKNNVGVDSANLRIARILKFGKYVETLKKESDHSTNDFQCAMNFDELLEYLYNSQKWYKFLTNIYKRLSDYETQKDTKTCKKATDKIITGFLKTKVSNTGLSQFLRECYKNEFDLEYNNIKDIILNQYKLEALNKVINVTLKQDVLIKYDSPNKLIVKGQFVKLTQVINASYSLSVKFIEVYALDTVFIDNTFNKTGEILQLSIIAPTWYIFGDRVQIILDGAQGKANTAPKALDGRGKGVSGYHGEPGLPGGNGGSFFGVGDSFINHQNLVISANGGSGGPGQNGGDGSKGQDGEIPEEVNQNQQETWRNKGYLVRRSGSTSFCLRSACVECKTWQVSGKTCTNGGNGGFGGSGGKGGNPGQTSMVILSNGTSIRFSKNVGETGRHGVGGHGGPPGKSGEILYVEDEKCPNMRSSTTLYSRKSSECAYGENVTHINEINISYPIITQTMFNQSIIINNYKSYVRENLHGNVKEPTLRNFIDKIEKEPTVLDLYDIFGLLHELYSLEIQFWNLKSAVQFSPFYQSLLYRINAYIQKIHNDTEYSQYHDVLNYLRLATMSKISSINNDLENYMVINVKDYFTLVAKHIQQYKHSLNEVKITAFKEDYRAVIRAKVQEANDLIQLTILPEINALYQQINQQIDELVEEILSEIKKKENQRDKLFEKQKELQGKLGMKNILSFLKFSSQFLSFAGPAGALAAGAIGTGLDVADRSISGDSKGTITKTAQASLSNINNYYKLEQQNLKVNLDLVKTQLSQSVRDEKNEDLKTVLEKLEPLRNKLNQPFVRDVLYHEEKWYTKRELQKMFNELLAQKQSLEKDTDLSNSKNKLEKEKDKLDLEKSTKEKKIIAKLRYITNVQNAISLGEMGYNLVDNIKKGQDMLTVVGESLLDVDTKITELKNYEDTIYESMIPMKNSFELALRNFSQTSTSKSLAALDVSKWKIQNTVKDFQTHMQFMFHGSDPLKGRFMGTIEKLQAGMLTMIQIYDRIQNYQDKTELVNYLAALNSEAKRTKNEQLNSIIDRLDLITKSNLILHEFDRAASAFKQYVFPFANFHLMKFELSPYLNLNNISSLINNAVEQIEYLSDQLTLDAMVIRNEPYHIYQNITFDQGQSEHQQPPYFIWNNHTHKTEISKLLSGEEVTLTADITKSINENAIKFKEIGIRFLAPNKTTQTDLDTKLADYLVKMKHLGKSYYRCDSKYYVINHNEITMKHSANKDRNNHYYNFDTTTAHIMNNPSMCSPYTTWKIRLSRQDRNNTKFLELNMFKTLDLDLALEGWGQYVELGLDVCHDDLSKYYQVAENLCHLLFL